MKALCGESSIGGVAAVEWGITHESEAIKMFEAENHVDVQPSGIWLHSSGVLGASPDGLVGDDSIVEVKCPFSARNGLFEIIKEGNFYIKEHTDGSYYLDATKDPGLQYYHQMQGTLHLTGRQWCHLVVWAPGELLILPVLRDPTWGQNIPVLVDFHRVHMQPLLKPTDVAAGPVTARPNSGQLLCILP